MTDSPQQAVILLSGGLDSSTLLAYARQTLKIPTLFAVSFLYGQKHSRELEMATWQAKRNNVAEHRVINMTWFSDVISGSSALTDNDISIPQLDDLSEKQRHQPPTYVPNRNMMLLSIAAAYAEAKGVTDIFYGAQAQDEYGYWDCTADFIEHINGVLELNRIKPVRVRAPFVAMCKADVLKLGLELGVDYSKTWTCYRGAATPCGSCPSCEERLKAFEQLGIAAIEPCEQSDEERAN